MMKVTCLDARRMTFSKEVWQRRYLKMHTSFGGTQSKSTESNQPNPNQLRETLDERSPHSFSNRCKAALKLNAWRTRPVSIFSRARRLSKAPHDNARCPPPFSSGNSSGAVRRSGRENC